VPGKFAAKTATAFKLGFETACPSKYMPTPPCP
jgi:hypothetical protein